MDKPIRTAAEALGAAFVRHCIKCNTCKLASAYGCDVGSDLNNCLILTMKAARNEPTDE